LVQVGDAVRGGDGRMPGTGSSCAPPIAHGPRVARAPARSSTTSVPSTGSVQALALRFRRYWRWEDGGVQEGPGR
jgi:hypothetical protein